MRAAGRRVPAAEGGGPGSDARGEQPRQKCVYVEPPRRIKEILEEHFHFQKEECNVKHPAAVALEGVWNVKNNFSIRNLKPVSQNSSDLLLQPQFYSRHAGMKRSGKKGETSGKMEWIQAIGMDKKEETMREDEPAVFSTRERGTSEGKGRSTGKDTYRRLEIPEGNSKKENTVQGHRDRSCKKMK